VSDWQTPPLSHPLYAALQDIAIPDDLHDWPSQEAYDALLTLNAGRIGFPLRFALDDEPDAYYEVHIGHTGDVPTRSRNWHDWFNAMAWLAWPRTKQALNMRHLRAISRGETRRGPLRDAATLLDECGVLVATSDPALGKRIDDMQWEELFVQERSAWGKCITAMTLGHALFETGLRPFIGWCGKALVVEVDDTFFTHDSAAQRDWLDAWLAERLADDAWLASPRALWPLPLLGIPGWWGANEHPDFYANRDYFRASRRTKSSTVTASSPSKTPES